MANQGTVSELIDAKDVALSDGTDNYLQLQDIVVNIGRPEYRESVVSGANYFYGHGDIYIEATILATTPEINTFVGFAALTSNAPVSKNWEIKYTDASNTLRKLTLTGTMAPLLRLEKPIEGAVKFRIRIRVTEEIAAGDVTST